MYKTVLTLFGILAIVWFLGTDPYQTPTYVLSHHSTFGSKVLSELEAKCYFDPDIHTQDSPGCLAVKEDGTVVTIDYVYSEYYETGELDGDIFIRQRGRMEKLSVEGDAEQIPNKMVTLITKEDVNYGTYAEAYAENKKIMFAASK